MAAPFDPDRLEVMGTPVPALEGVMGTSTTGAGQYSFSRQGSLVYVPGSGQGDPAGKLVWVDRNGVEEPLGAPSRPYQNPRLSPDGRRIAFTIREANPDIWVYEIARQTLSRLTFDPEEDERPIWTPDGMWLTYSSDRPDGRTLFRKQADGGGEEEPLVTLPGARPRHFLVARRPRAREHETTYRCRFGRICFTSMSSSSRGSHGTLVVPWACSCFTLVIPSE